MKTEFKIWLVNYLLSPFSWSKWADICTFSFAYNAYLLQGKVNKRTNAKIFRVTAMKGMIGVADVGSIELDQLKKCGLIDETVKFNL